MATRYKPEFWARVISVKGKGGWTFAIIPEKYSPPVTHAWGRTPVRATVDGHTWDTSVWRSKDGNRVLALPKRVRGEKTDGDRVRVTLEFRSL
jgi:hypothetical protein